MPSSAGLDLHSEKVNLFGHAHRTVSVNKELAYYRLIQPVDLTANQHWAMNIFYPFFAQYHILLYNYYPPIVHNGQDLRGEEISTKSLQQEGGFLHRSGRSHLRG